MSKSKPLFILVEGDNDERFVRVGVCPFMRKKYDQIVVWKWAEEKDRIVNEFIQVINNMGADYLFITDLDACACATEAKANVQGKYPALAPESIVVATCEVESWYLAGLSKASAAAVGLPESAGIGSTEAVTKEQFLRIRPPRYAAETAYRVEVLNHFQRASASRRNASFARLARKYLR
jgi:hypothetical protein